VLKVYLDTGHFIHTDNPVEFSADVVDFITLGNVEPSPLAVDRLINGATTVGMAVAPTPAGPSPTVGLNK
jgi:homoserine O-acetyltransferase/O-succinyltransferase